jgi:hypothetical protein
MSNGNASNVAPVPELMDRSRTFERLGHS